MANKPGVVIASKRIIHPVDQVLPPERLVVYGLQHVLAFYAGAVIVPLLLSAAIGLTQEQTVALISADLFTCGIASIIQAVGFWNVGVRLPLIQGVMLITAVETTGDVFATGEIVEKAINQEDIARALRADGLSTLLGGILNSFPYTCFAENIGLVRLTRVKSRFVVAAAGMIMMLLGLFPKVAALVDAIPPSVLGGAATILFATVAVVGIQTLSRVDFHEERNVVIVAVSIGLGMIPVAFPNFYKNFPEGWQIIVGNSITTGSLAAILLNFFFNVLTGKGELMQEFTPTPRHVQKLSIIDLNALTERQFVEKIGRLFHSGNWIAESAYQKRPFKSMYDLRRALQDAVFEAPQERQLELIKSYPDLGRFMRPEEVSAPASSDGAASPYEIPSYAVEGLARAESLRDQSSAGLDRLTPEESASFNSLNKAYRDKFGFPLVVCVRENTKETILASGKERLENSPAQEKAAGLVEIIKIANLRLQDIIETPIAAVATA
jgi:2-oxo-4-hydroxy-4-carboxy--5-ureidoimidazoline (OHCU) decarboxylase